MKANFILSIMSQNRNIHFLLLTFLIFIGSTINAQIVYTSATTLQTAVNAASTTGGTFILKDGSYSGFKLSITAIAAPANPIIIQSQTIGGVTLTGDSYVNFKAGAAYITLQGFNFNCTGKSTMVKMEGNNNIRITRNVFKLTISDGISSVKWVYIGGVYNDTTLPYQYLSHHNRVDHNIFQDKNLPGHYITIDGTNSLVQSQYDQIDHNYFKNNSPRAVNEQESIRVGWSDMSKSSGFTTVEYNLFEGCDGDPEVLSVKSCDNIIRHNTFRGNYGTLSFRHGNRNRAEGNYFFGNSRPIGLAPDGVTNLYTGGMRIYGTDHVIINNYFEGLNGTKWDAPITLTQGDAIEGTGALSNHFRAERVTIAYNTLVNNDSGIEIGFTNNNAYSKGLVDIKILNNLITGSKNSLVKIVDGKDQGTAITWTNNLMYPTGTATLINGATTTTLTNPGQVIIENPNLTFDGATSTWKSTATTPLYANTAVITNNEDIEGQSRPSTSNPGADHFSSLESVRYLPMTSATVGPLAYEDVPLALSPIANFVLAGESKITNVTTSLAWTATIDNPSWLSINTNSGTGNGSITITAASNTTGIVRTGLLTVTGTSTPPVTLAITQDGATLTLSSLSDFTAAGESKATAVTSNVSWNASIDNPSWLSINATSGINNGSIIVTATANTTTTSRTGTLTVTGSGMTPTTLTITQLGLPSGAGLINTGTNGNPVSVTATNTQAGANIATNTLDKQTGTKWSDDGTGAPFGVLTYDLGGQYTFESIKIATTGVVSPAKFYYYSIQFSADGVNYSAPVNVQSAAATQTTYATYPFTNVARYVKITGGGNNLTAFTSVSEIEFWGFTYLSVKDNKLNNAVMIYPVPAKNNVTIESPTTITKVEIYAIDGKKVLEKNTDKSAIYSLDVTNLTKGIYILKVYGDASAAIYSKQISVSH